jgi:1-acyl-sn-glycerol-3-phosphate acyltransferase
LVLTHRFVPADAYAMMDAANLRRRPFFASVGAFGVDRDSRRDGAEATRYAAALLDRPGRLVWIFPQGQERPLHERPLQFFGGSASIAQRVPSATVLPVGLAYAFGATAAPSTFASVGPPVPRATAARTRQAQVDAVEAELARIEREQSNPGSQGFTVHALRRPSLLEHLAERALSTLARPLVPGLRSLPEARR